MNRFSKDTGLMDEQLPLVMYDFIQVNYLYRNNVQPNYSLQVKLIYLRIAHCTRVHMAPIFDSLNILRLEKLTQCLCINYTMVTYLSITKTIPTK